MSTAPHQVFPRRDGDGVSHHRWAVDLASARKLARARGLTADRLAQEADEMARHLPRWITTVSQQRRLIRCRRCDGLLVFHRGLRCVACDSAHRGKLARDAHLAWFGLLPPVGIDGLPRVAEGLEGQVPPGHVCGRHESLGRYLLVPLVTTYPPGFPRSEPEVYYQPGFFQLPGMPAERPAHEYHMLDHGRLCLFASGEWRRRTTVRQVLQQRAYAHAIKMLNYANGKTAAFAKVS